MKQIFRSLKDKKIIDLMKVKLNIASVFTKKYLKMSFLTAVILLTDTVYANFYISGRNESDRKRIEFLPLGLP